MGMTSTYYRISQETLEHVRQDEQAFEAVQYELLGDTMDMLRESMPEDDFPQDMDVLHHEIEQKRTQLPTIHHASEENGPHSFSLDKTAVALAMGLSPATFGAEPNALHTRAITAMLIGEGLGDGGEVLHEHRAEEGGFPGIVIYPHHIRAAVDELTQLEKDVVKEEYASDLVLREFRFRDSEECFETFFWPDLMRFKEFLEQVVQTNDSLLVVFM